MSQAREPDDDRHGDNWHWDDPFARQLEAPGGGDRSSGVRSSTFDELIDGWRREGRVPEWPDEPAPDVPDGHTDQADRPSAEPADAPAGGPLDPDDDHYVPPEPPPLPKLGAPAVVGLGLLGLGLLLLVAPWWIGVSETFAIPLGLLALASGLGWLVLRLWPPQPTGDGDGEDDGAVI